MHEQMIEALDRIEAKLDALIAALLDEADEADMPAPTLDGDPSGAARTPGTPL